MRQSNRVKKRKTNFPSFSGSRQSFTWDAFAQTLRLNGNYTASKLQKTAADPNFSTGPNSNPPLQTQHFLIKYQPQTPQNRHSKYRIQHTQPHIHSSLHAPHSSHETATALIRSPVPNDLPGITGEPPEVVVAEQLLLLAMLAARLTDARCHQALQRRPVPIGCGRGHGRHRGGSTVWRLLLLLRLSRLRRHYATPILGALSLQVRERLDEHDRHVDVDFAGTGVVRGVDRLGGRRR